MMTKYGLPAVAVMTCLPLFGSVPVTNPSPSPTAQRGYYGRVAFLETVLATTADGVASVRGADLDGDGATDILVGMRDSGTVAWYRNLGSEVFESISIVSNAEDGILDAIAYDVDGDGFLDIVAASNYDGMGVWFENLGNAAGWARHVFDSNALDIMSVAAADLNNDGSVDLVASTQTDAVYWYENDSQESFTRHAVQSAGSTSGASMVLTGDFNGDSNVDLAAAITDQDTVMVYLGSGSGFWQEVTVDNSVDSVVALAAEDMDGDGDLDLVSISAKADSVYWHENSNGIGTSWVQHTIASSVANAYFTDVTVADIEGDGDMDVVSFLVKVLRRTPSINPSKLFKWLFNK